MRSNSNIISTAIFTLCLTYIAITLTHTFISPVGIYDEGFSLANALRILNGDIPHKDYWSAYPPGTSITIALLFSIFQPSIFIARIAHLIWSIILLGSLFLCLREFASFRRSLIATAIASSWLAASLYPSYAVTPAIALTLLSLALLLLGIQRKSKTTAILAGTIGGTCILFRHDIAFYLLASTSIAFLINTYTANSKSEYQLNKQPYIVYIVTTIISATILLCLILAVCNAQEFVQQAIIFPATGMRANRLLQIPGLFDFFITWKTRWLLAWIVPILLCFGLLNTILIHKERNFNESQFIGIFAALSIFLTFQSHNRLDMAHAAPSMLFLLCFLVTSSTTTLPSKEYYIRTSNKFILASFTIYSLFATTGHIEFKNIKDCFSTTIYASQNPSSCIPTNAQQSEIVKYINRNYDESERVFIGNTRHDKIFINDAYLYFLLARPIPVKWNEMHPGVANTKEVQLEIIRQIEERGVNVIILGDMPESNENNASAISSEVYFLDNFIANKFQIVFKNKNYFVLERRKILN